MNLLSDKKQLAKSQSDEERDISTPGEKKGDYRKHPCKYMYGI
jgi:hypothetical protein